MSHEYDSTGKIINYEPSDPSLRNARVASVMITYATEPSPTSVVLDIGEDGQILGEKVVVEPTKQTGLRGAGTLAEVLGPEEAERVISAAERVRAFNLEDAWERHGPQVARIRHARERRR